MQVVRCFGVPFANLNNSFEGSLTTHEYLFANFTCIMDDSVPFTCRLEQLVSYSVWWGWILYPLQHCCGIIRINLTILDRFWILHEASQFLIWYPHSVILFLLLPLPHTVLLLSRWHQEYQTSQQAGNLQHLGARSSKSSNSHYNGNCADLLAQPTQNYGQIKFPPLVLYLNAPVNLATFSFLDSGLFAVSGSFSSLLVHVDTFAAWSRSRSRK